MTNSTKTATIAEQVAQLKQAVTDGDHAEAEKMLALLGERRLKAEHRAIIEEIAEQLNEDGGISNLAKQMAKYRATYKRGVTANGDKSLHNGDALARYLEMRTPEEVCQLADEVCGEVNGFHEAKYERLNNGQKRMNAGNRIRNKIKQGEWEVTDKGLVQAA